MSVGEERRPDASRSRDRRSTCKKIRVKAADLGDERVGGPAALDERVVRARRTSTRRSTTTTASSASTSTTCTWRTPRRRARSRASTDAVALAPAPAPSEGRRREALTDGRPGGRFERHPRLTGAGLLACALLLVELALRLGRARAARVRARDAPRAPLLASGPRRPAALAVGRGCASTARTGSRSSTSASTTGPEGFRVDEAAGRARRRPARALPPRDRRLVHDGLGRGRGRVVSGAARAAARAGASRAEPRASTASARSALRPSRGRSRSAIRRPWRSTSSARTTSTTTRGRRPWRGAAGWRTRRRRRSTACAARATWPGIPFALRYRLQFRAGPATTAGEAGAETEAAVIRQRCCC